MVRRIFSSVSHWQARWLPLPKSLESICSPMCMIASREPSAQYCELKQRWEAPLVPGEEMGPADQPFGQNPQSVALAQRVRAVADGAS